MLKGRCLRHEFLLFLIRIQAVASEVGGRGVGVWGCCLKREIQAMASELGGA